MWNIDKKEKIYYEYNNKLNQSILYYSISILVKQINLRKEKNENIDSYCSCLGNILYLCFKIYHYAKSEISKEENKSKIWNFFSKEYDNLSLTFVFILFDDFFTNSELSFNGKLIISLLQNKDNYFKKEILK
jgi:hypothetical protein